uniref:beta-ketoacyl-[acyl-carrier-protein] synthase III n=1 Tax=Polytomella parva TaxID=51329 RepID=A0A7S0USX3_9CHLO|mmetsp:Transcript_20518/g.36812  ORF Transcript_20518/g.36812 Transcript_20518/m.36812 type:complete len:403 (+) Transcript_20518:150-1358(+)|eukprot:CAMPEP_0175084302 /NCGR_PEP_ID=MMETSP0052_2-20121109/27967_1 /TAXON_ID=51329 ORGANISM="Polytomella parva, Strain SAG 63-3" /NCGR_SAMPLE_ID=MMETSP0052_2 /ASSEMBLY_ACC=CAM_ASM_000194 /LENGTH=402 /DNA_ID=CAMNT_0016356057 /DNA_START=109 /DNA_END=1317 /DNA_ORIENTATION=-
MNAIYSRSHPNNAVITNSNNNGVYKSYAVASTVNLKSKRISLTRTKAVKKEMTGCRLMGVGSCTPKLVLHNRDMEKFVNTTDEWICSRTGIRERHIIGRGETLTQLSINAAQRALEMAGVSAKDVDMIIMATSTPDDTFGNACQVQYGVGASKAVAFDLSAACSGFVVALNTAVQFIRTGSAHRILVIGADAMSRIIDWRDRSTCVLFGDGAGAVLLSASDCPEAVATKAPNSNSTAPSSSDCALLGMFMASDGQGHKSLKAVYAGEHEKPLQPDDVASGHASYKNVQMAGQEVYKFAVRTVPAALETALKRAELNKSDVDWLVMHQANQRIMDAAAARLNLAPTRVVSNLARYGNTSAASIPLALDEAVRDGRIQHGDVLAMVGFGAGLTWASAIVKWGKF